MQQSSTLVHSLRIYVPFIFSLMIIFPLANRNTPALKSRTHLTSHSDKNKSTVTNDHNDGWLETVKRNIANQEYNIEQEKGTQAFL